MLAATGWTAAEVGHVNAHGVSTVEMDRVEAQAVAAELGDVPVPAAKSSFGHLGAGATALRLRGPKALTGSEAAGEAANCADHSGTRLTSHPFPRTE